MKQKFLTIYFNFFRILAKIYISKYKPYVIGITGSVGKTSCRMIISKILQKHLSEKIVFTSNKNFNGELGLSLSILGIGDYKPQILSIIKTVLFSIKRSLFGKKLYDIIILEYGIDHIGEMDFLLSIVKPNIGILTGIGKVHSSQFQSEEIIASEKYKLLQNTINFCFLNIDDKYSQKYKNTIKCEKYYFSIKNDSFSLINGENGIKSVFDLVINNKKIIVESNLIGKENIGYIEIGYCILQKIFSKYYEKIDLNIDLLPSRFSIFEGIYDSILIDSSYNASPQSMIAVIENTKNYAKKLNNEYSLILCLGEMRELGKYTEQEHKKLAEYTLQLTDIIFVVGENMRKYFLPISKNAIFFKNSKMLGMHLKEFLKQSNKKYLILFKGSQNEVFLEEALKQVLKYPEDVKKICRQEDFWIHKKEVYFQKF